MKRCILIVAALMVILAPLCASYAAETTFSGEYRVRSWSEWNFAKIPGYLSPDDAGPIYTGFFDQRFRLTITHKRSEYLKAVIRFDLVEDVWGQQRGFRMNNATDGSIIDLAYIDFTIPNLGTFTVGRFPEKYGTAGLIFSPYDGTDGARWSNKWGPVSVSLLYSKMRDYVTTGSGGGPATNWYNHDTNLWGLNLKVVPANNQLIELYGGVVTADNANWLLSKARGWSGHVPTGNPNYIDANLGFVGLSYTGNFAKMIDVKAEYSWIFGRANMNEFFRPTLGGAAFNEDPSVEGWNLYLDASYYNEVFRVGVAYIMGSGDRHYWNPGSVQNINLNYLVDSDRFKWANIIGQGTRGIEGLGSGRLGTDNNIENLTSVKLYFSATPMEKLTVNAAVIWAKWTNPVGSGPRVASDGPGYRHPINDWGNANGYTINSWEASDDLGWEIDLGFSYDIMEGLTYTFAGGVLFTGDSFDYVNPVTNGREDWGPIWSISNKIEYKF